MAARLAGRARSRPRAARAAGTGSSARARGAAPPPASRTIRRGPAGGGSGSSSSTTRTSARLEKSHIGGSMKARCPFSPIPRMASDGRARAGAPRSARHSASRSRASPARPWKARTGTCAKRRSTRKRAERGAGCVASTPMYSSRWKAVTRSQGMPASRAQRGQELVLRGRGREDRSRAARGAPPRAADGRETTAAAARSHRGPIRMHLDGQAGRGASVGAGFTVRRAAQLARGPAHEVRQRDPPAPRARDASASPTRTRPSGRSRARRAVRTRSGPNSPRPGSRGTQPRGLLPSSGAPRP